MPFVNALILYIFLREGQLLNKQYEWFKNTILPRIPVTDKVLGGCIICTAFWLGFAEMIFIRNDWTGVLLLFYNACVTSFIYKSL